MSEKVPKEGKKEVQGGKAGRGPGRTYTAVIKKTEEATPRRAPSRFSERPNETGPDKGKKPNDGSK